MRLLPQCRGGHPGLKEGLILLLPDLDHPFFVYFFVYVDKPKDAKEIDQRKTIDKADKLLKMDEHKIPLQ